MTLEFYSQEDNTLSNIQQEVEFIKDWIFSGILIQKIQFHLRFLLSWTINTQILFDDPISILFTAIPVSYLRKYFLSLGSSIPCIIDFTTHTALLLLFLRLLSDTFKRRFLFAWVVITLQRNVYIILQYKGNQLPSLTRIRIILGWIWSEPFLSHLFHNNWMMPELMISIFFVIYIV